MSINKKRVKLLVDALRSEKYTQAHEQLRHKGSYCCLGVACDVSGVGQWSGDSYVTDVSGISSEERLVLPTAVREWYGFESSSPELVDGGYDLVEAAVMNDNGADFAIIADAFERTFLKEKTDEPA